MRCWFVSVFVTLLALTNFAAAEAPTERSFSVADVRTDFQDLYQRLQASHFDLYARRPKAEYDALYRTMLASFDRPLTAFEVQTRFERFMAFGRIAHARIDFPADAYGAYRDAGGKIMPILFRIVRGRAYVAQNDSGLDAVALGDEILTLNGDPMDGWLRRLAANVSADNDYMANTLLERRLPALLWLELGPVDRFALKLRKANGATLDVVVSARSRDEIKAATAAQTQTLNLDWDTREFKVLPAGVGYLRPGPSYNNDPNATDIWDVRQFRDLIDGAFTEFLRAGTKALVIDLRDNPGGDNSFSDLMVGWFATKPFRFTSDFRIKVSQAAIDSNRQRVEQTPNDTDSISHKFAAAYAKHRIGDVFSFDLPMAYPRQGARFTGKVYLLINRHSYSNTVQVAALAQDYGFATILGEETSDLATTYGAMEQFTLPRTATVVGFPKALIIRANGDRAARGVIPEIAIETPIVQLKDDAVLTRALEIARGVTNGAGAAQRN